MSYILDALKKSQRERELGQVPRLQAPVFDEPLEQTRAQRWIIATFALAALAAVLAAYAALRPPIANAPEVSEAEVESAPESESPASSANTEEPVVVDSAVDRAVDNALAALPRADADHVGETGGTADDRDAEPQVLVVPAPPKPGERLPRGADELRRAVLGVDAASSPEPRKLTQPKAPVPEHAPVPPELIAEIEAFKRTFREEGGRGSAARAETASKSAERRTQPATQAAPPLRDRPAPLSSSLRRELPPFSMTVHVYDPDPARRFVYLNGSKLREGELARDGFFVEEVRADGAVLRYDAHRFFLSP
jgi:general secretion pathway protein B